MITGRCRVVKLADLEKKEAGEESPSGQKASAGSQLKRMLGQKLEPVADAKKEDLIQTFGAHAVSQHRCAALNSLPIWKGLCVVPMDGFPRHVYWSRVKVRSPAGDSMGDWGLLSGFRVQTIVCESDVEVLFLKKDHYVESIMNKSDAILQENIQFIRECPLFARFGKAVVDRTANIIKKVKSCLVHPLYASIST